MFEAWGRRVYAWRWATLVGSSLLLAASLAMVVRGGPLETGVIRGIEADNAALLVDKQLRSEHTSGFEIIFHHDELTADDAEFQTAVQKAVAPLRKDPHVARVRTPWDAETGMYLGQTMLSVEGHDALATVVLKQEAIETTRFFPSIREKLRSDTLKITVTGYASFRSDLDRAIEHDIARAELVSAPLTALVLLLAFGSIVAALLPVGVGGAAVMGGIAGVLVLSHFVPIAQYALNIVQLIGLGLAIDYSLFMVARFREELFAGKTVPDALARTVATAGRAVVFSGLAVAIGLGGLMFFRGSYLASIGLGGTVVVILLVFYSLTFLPALLAVLGHHVNKGRVPIPLRMPTDFWHKLAVRVMRRPLLFLLPALGVLFVAGLPFKNLRIAVPTPALLPPHSETLKGLHELERAFPERALTRIAVVVEFPGSPIGSKDRVLALGALHQKLLATEGVDRIDDIFNADPFMSTADFATALTGPAADLGEPLALAKRESVGKTIAVFGVLTEYDPSSEEARALVREIRSVRQVGDGKVLVTGLTALDLDTVTYLKERAPYAIAFVVVMTLLVLFGLLGSVVLPIKAVVMNIVSLSGSFGALVWIFQEGHLAGLLNFVPRPIEPSLPVLLFCVTFGLSMDYEVLLLTRMQEEYLRSHDNTKAVALGLERSGQLITSAAAIMVAVFASYVGADVILLKSLGIGMAIAVTLDATIVRVIIVPATMRLFGDLNWWAPKMFSFLQQKRHEH